MATPAGSCHAAGACPLTVLTISANRTCETQHINRGNISCRAAAIHGDMDQHSRMAVLSEFKAGRHHVLVATDVAARGLDIKCGPPTAIC